MSILYRLCVILGVIILLVLEPVFAVLDYIHQRREAAFP